MAAAVPPPPPLILTGQRRGELLSAWLDRHVGSIEPTRPTLVYVGLQNCPFCLGFDDEWEQTVQPELSMDQIRTVSLQMERGHEYARTKALLGFQTVPALCLFLPPTGGADAAGVHVYVYPSADRSASAIMTWIQPLTVQWVAWRVQRMVEARDQNNNVLLALVRPDDVRWNEYTRTLARHFENDLVQVQRVTLQQIPSNFQIASVPAFIYICDGQLHILQGGDLLASVQDMFEWIYRVTYYPTSLAAVDR